MRTSALSADDLAGSRGPRFGQLLLILWATALFIRDLIPGAPTALTASKTLFPLWWLIRAAQGDPTWQTDLFLCLGLDYIYNRGFWILRPGFYEWLHRTQSEHVVIYVIMAASALFSFAIVSRGEAGPIEHGKHEKEAGLLLPPLLIPARTTHSRMFPKKHSFSYSYFYVGIPVGWKGRAGSALSADVDVSEEGGQKRGWFHVDSADCLDRSNQSDGLEGKLERYMDSQSVSTNEWSFAYLVTAPRFLGYSFNPVSFWYLYDSDDSLKYMILEVNNTFDERRLYLLKAEGKPNDDDDVRELADETTEPPKPVHTVKFSNVWKKDFHVSPFNDRSGSYSLVASNPLDSVLTGDRMIDNTIVLRTPEGHAKLVARVYSEGPPKDPAKLGALSLVRVLFAWSWTGFVTFPRILREAWKLYFRRGLNVYFRPEVANTSIGRQHSHEEQTLERFFRAYLTYRVSQCTSPLQVVYQPPDGMGDTATFDSPLHRAGDKAVPELTIRVLSPAFYSRIVHYSHTIEAFDREGIATDDLNRTIEVGNAEHISLLLSSEREKRAATVTVQLSTMDNIRWLLLQYLRCPPPAMSYGNSKQNDSVVTDIRSRPLSSLDRYVQKYCRDASIYRQTVVKTFLAQRLAYGFTAAITFVDLLIRSGLLITGVWSAACHEDVGFFDWQSVNVESLWPLIAVSLVHIWALLVKC